MVTQLSPRRQEEPAHRYSDRRRCHGTLEAPNLSSVRSFRGCTSCPLETSPVPGSRINLGLPW